MFGSRFWNARFWNARYWSAIGVNIVAPNPWMYALNTDNWKYAKGMTANWQYRLDTSNFKVIQ